MASSCVFLNLPKNVQVYICNSNSLCAHTHHAELKRYPTCHPHPGERKTKRKRAGMIERETGRWRDGDEGGACSACLDVNNAPEGSAANCQLLIFVVSFNHLRSPLLHHHHLPSLSHPSTLHLTLLPPPTPLAMQRSAWIFYISASLHALRLLSMRLILRPSEFASSSHFFFNHPFHAHTHMHPYTQRLMKSRCHATARKSTDGYHSDLV